MCALCYSKTEKEMCAALELLFLLIIVNQITMTLAITTRAVYLPTNLSSR